MKIAIFVSHRIDLQSACINDPIYHNMRCGAVFDAGKSSIPGDDTGDNISEKRESYCELTVQYWAWKNCKADYYGLCHYRRYLSFTDTEYLTKRHMVFEGHPLNRVASKYNLNNTKVINALAAQYDALIPQSIAVSAMEVRIPNQRIVIPKTVYEFWTSKTDQIDKNCLDYTIELVKKYQPKYYDALMESLTGSTFIGSNCHVMKRELFEEMCEFQFSIIDRLVQEYDMSAYTGEWVRQPGFMGEVLFGAYVTHLKHREDVKLSERQIIFLRNPQKVKNSALYAVADKLFPFGTQRRELVKKVLKQKGIFPSRQTTRHIAYTRSVVANSAQFFNAKRDASSMTANPLLGFACLATEIHETHKQSFSEFKYCNRGRDVVILASGPTLSNYVNPIAGAVNIGMNKSFKYDKVKLDYYFTTDFEARNEWFDELKAYDNGCVKFFGQYSNGIFRNRFQVTEQLIYENNGRRFFQGAPSEDIHINIEYYPLMGFYSIAFQAIHFALYTYPRRIYLVGCDCSSGGYFDGTKQLGNAQDRDTRVTPTWVTGYTKLKEFVGRFYPDIEIVSVNPVGLRGLFRDVYTKDYLEKNPETDCTNCEVLE